MTLLRALIASLPTLNRRHLSREFCRGIGWFKPDSGLRDMMAWAPMLTDRPGTARPNGDALPKGSLGAPFILVGLALAMLEADGLESRQSSSRAYCHRRTYRATFKPSHR